MILYEEGRELYFSSSLEMDWVRIFTVCLNLVSHFCVHLRMLYLPGVELNRCEFQGNSSVGLTLAFQKKPSNGWWEGSAFTHCLISSHTSVLQARCFYHLWKELNSCEFQSHHILAFQREIKGTLKNTLIFLKVILEFSRLLWSKFYFKYKKNWAKKYWQTSFAVAKNLRVQQGPSATW